MEQCLPEKVELVIFKKIFLAVMLFMGLFKIRAHNLGQNGPANALKLESSSKPWPGPAVSR